jgi:Tfp pilus assembly protein FimT
MLSFGADASIGSPLPVMTPHLSSFLPSKRPRCRHRDDAMTFIDLLIYISLLILTSTAVVRTSYPFIEQRRLRTAAIELSGYFQVARSVALATNVPCIITLNQNDRGVFMPDSNPQNNSCSPTLRHIPPVVKLADYSGSRNLSADVAANSAGFPITFSPDGTINNNVTVLLSSTNVPQGVWCVNIQAPLATIRTGWRPAGESNCNYSIEH